MLFLLAAADAKCFRTAAGAVESMVEGLIAPMDTLLIVKVSQNDLRV